jgi:hypothetical protein
MPTSKLTHRFEFAAGALGFLFGLLIMTCDYLVLLLSRREIPDPFIRAPEVMVWIFLVAAQFGFWLNAVPYQWRWRSEVKERFQIGYSTEIGAKHLLAILLFAVPASLIAFALPATHLAHYRPKLFLVNVVGVLVALVPIEGIWYIRAAIEKRTWQEQPSARNEQGDKAKIEDYLFLRDNLERFITFLGLMIGLATLAKGASRHALIATGGSQHDYPPEYVLLHGAYFTGLLALVYIPTYSRLLAVGSDLLDMLFPISSPTLDLKNFSSWQSNRKGLEELLELKSSALENLRASVAILTPLASSAVSILIGDKLLLGTS